MTRQTEVFERVAWSYVAVVFLFAAVLFVFDSISLALDAVLHGSGKRSGSKALRRAQPYQPLKNRRAQPSLAYRHRWASVSLSAQAR